MCYWIAEQRLQRIRGEGGGSLPVTLFFDANGALVHSHAGEMSAVSLQQSIEQYF